MAFDALFKVRETRIPLTDAVKSEMCMMRRVSDLLFTPFRISFYQHHTGTHVCYLFSQYVKTRREKKVCAAAHTHQQ